MRSIAGTRSFHCGRQLQRPARLQKSSGILPPLLPVEVNRQKMAALVR
jgi:hypothetical protein